MTRSGSHPASPRLPFFPSSPLPPLPLPPQPRLPGEERCERDPFQVLPDRSRYVDQQQLKLQVWTGVCTV